MLSSTEGKNHYSLSWKVEFSAFSLDPYVNIQEIVQRNRLL
jgi:hypothetical protein